MKDFTECISQLPISQQAKEMIFSENFLNFMHPRKAPAIKAGELLKNIR
jgi:hypothetical protein